MDGSGQPSARHGQPSPRGQPYFSGDNVGTRREAGLELGSQEVFFRTSKIDHSRLLGLATTAEHRIAVEPSLDERGLNKIKVYFFRLLINEIWI